MDAIKKRLTVQAFLRDKGLSLMSEIIFREFHDHIGTGFDTGNPHFQLWQNTLYKVQCQ